MKNIKIIKTGIDPKPFLEQIQPKHWKWVSQQTGVVGKKNPYGFLPLTMAKVKKGENPKNTEGLGNTVLYSHFTEVHKFWKEWNIQKTARAAFFKLQPDGRVGKHIDEGTYYLTKDRYHLSLQGRYHYTVGDEEMIVEPGTFFWFYNKVPHGAHNIGDIDRITLVWDTPHNEGNPHHTIRA